VELYVLYYIVSTDCGTLRCSKKAILELRDLNEEVVKQWIKELQSVRLSSKDIRQRLAGPKMR
jgi:hypothetical protein